MLILIPLSPPKKWYLFVVKCLPHMYEALDSMPGTNRQTWVLSGYSYGKGEAQDWIAAGLNRLRCPGDLACSLSPLCGRKNWSETRGSLGLWSSLPTGLMIASPSLPSMLTCPSSEYAHRGLSETEVLWPLSLSSQTQGRLSLSYLDS